MVPHRKQTILLLTRGFNVALLVHAMQNTWGCIDKLVHV